MPPEGGFAFNGIAATLLHRSGLRQRRTPRIARSKKDKGNPYLNFSALPRLSAIPFTVKITSMKERFDYKFNQGSPNTLNFSSEPNF
jgi:hypothetical protein